MSAIEGSDSAGLLHNANDSLCDIWTALEPLNNYNDQYQTINNNNYDTAGLLDDLTDKLNSVENAKLNVSLAYTLGSLYFTLLRSKGKLTEKHNIKDELMRIKKHVEKIKAVEQDIKSVEVKGKLIIDSSAAKRIVSHELSANNEVRNKKQKRT